MDESGSESGLSMHGREKGIRQLMAINMLKRLESSVNSFRLTIQRIQELIQNTINRIDNFSRDRYGHTSLEVDDYYPSMVAKSIFVFFPPTKAEP